MRGVPGHVPAHEVAVADALLVRDRLRLVIGDVATLAEDGVGDVPGVQGGQLADLAGVVRAAFALVGGGVAGPPHERVGDELPGVPRKRERVTGPWGRQRDGGIQLGHGQAPTAAAIASPSRVWAFSRARSVSSSAWKVARSTAVGRPGWAR